MNLSGGQLIDLDSVYILDPTTKALQWTTPPYHLCFSFTDSAKGIALYSAKIVLDKAGKVVEEIDLPNIRCYPEKGRLMPLEEIKKTSRKNHYYHDETDISLEYDDETETIIWRFFKLPAYNSHYPFIDISDIDANTGRVIRKSKQPID